MKKLLFLLFLSQVLYGCMSLKDDYPAITYYNFEQGPKPAGEIKKLEGTLQIRDFTVSSSYDTDHLLAKYGTPPKIKKYYYNRWIADPGDMVTNFFVNRFNILSLFSGGVIKSASVLVPDYILEGQVINLIGINGENDDPGENSVAIGIKITLVKRANTTVKRSVLIAKVYEINVDRNDSSAESMAEAFSDGLTQIADKLMIDIQKAIRN